MIEGLGNRISQLRKNHHLSQGELADALGVTSALISSWERSERIPVVPKLLKLCDIFNVSTDYLLGRNSSNHISLEGLSPNDAKAVATIIKSLREKNIKN